MRLVSRLPVSCRPLAASNQTLPPRDAHVCTMKKIQYNIKMCSNPKNVRLTGR
ncbi:Uncharacterized protein FWK35_00037997, partial [Aphis craccivora]